MKSLPETIFARLTGSGSCIFAAFESKILAEESLAIFNKRFPLIWSKVVENNFI
jgi:4-diphosphocytidyl-2C-methyl-D-erythritol kinase